MWYLNLWILIKTIVITFFLQHSFDLWRLWGHPFGIRAFPNIHFDWVVMQVKVENVFNNIFRVVILKKFCDVGEPLASIIPFIKLFYDVHFFLYYQHGQHVKKVTIIELFSGTRQGDPFKRSFICFGPLSSFFKDHHVGLLLRLSIPIRWYSHRWAYEWDYLHLWPPFDPINFSQV